MRVVEVTNAYKKNKKQIGDVCKRRHKAHPSFDASRRRTRKYTLPPSSFVVCLFKSIQIMTYMNCFTEAV